MKTSLKKLFQRSVPSVCNILVILALLFTFDAPATRVDVGIAPSTISYQGTSQISGNAGVSRAVSSYVYDANGNRNVGGSKTYTYDGLNRMTALADEAGNYSFTVPVNWSGTVTPSKASCAVKASTATTTSWAWISLSSMSSLDLLHFSESELS